MAKSLVIKFLYRRSHLRHTSFSSREYTTKKFASDAKVHPNAVSTKNDSGLSKVWVINVGMWSISANSEINYEIN